MRDAKTAVVLYAQVVRPDDVRARQQADALWGQLMPANALTSGFVQKRRNVLITQIAVEADLLGTSLVVLILDRAENLSIPQFDGLKNLLEELKAERGLSCFCVLAGQSELLAMPRRLQRALRHTLVAEFLVGLHRFRGVVPRELRDVLTHYDNTRFPEPRGRTYTQEYCPELWSRGMRFADFAAPMQERFSKILKASARGVDEIGMEYVTAAARRFLFSAEAIAAEHGRPQLNAFAAHCVDSCGLSDSLVVLGNPETDALAPTAQRRGTQ
ncbi:hypothetical protein [Pelomonas sp. KK5]|uniref:hypothetical protein n=1 Tax=Pelomonas sp. KK5 TaxID=1855730 RepID=UPI00097C45B2|nr:hypothetical protein [Pelomonas sp. KK5]